MAVDLDGAFYACRAVLPGMIHRKALHGVAPDERKRERNENAEHPSHAGIVHCLFHAESFRDIFSILPRARRFLNAVTEI